MVTTADSLTVHQRQAEQRVPACTGPMLELSLPIPSDFHSLASFTFSFVSASSGVGGRDASDMVTTVDSLFLVGNVTCAISISDLKR
jgi:hypothetical protein